MVTETEPVLGTIETPFNLYIIGGQEHQIEKRFPYQGRKRGYICLYCSSNYHTIPIRDKAGNIVRHEPVVKLDPRPGYIGETARGSFIPNAPQAKRESHLPVRQLRFAPQRKEGRRG